MEGGDGCSDLVFNSLSPTPSPLSRLSISSFSFHSSPFHRLRLSSCTRDANQAIPAPRRKLAWVSLQGRLVGAGEASCGRTIGGSLSLENSFAWDLFSPLHRVLAVAIVAAATADGEKSRQISQLQKSVDIRDMVLASMQQKLDDLCDQMNCLKDGARDCGGRLFTTYDEYSDDEGHKSDEAKINICELAYELNPLEKVIPFESEVTAGLQTVKEDIFVVPHSREPEERRMSDLSYCSSIASSVDIQLSTLAAEQDSFNLRRECEEKDEIIKELTASVHESRITSSKRISDLEDVIRRKNMVINKMKKDMLILEQKLIQFTRQRRPSSSSSSTSSEVKLPVMATNLLFDMSSSSPSSSDSDSSSDAWEHQGRSSGEHDIERSSSYGYGLNASCDMIRGASLDGHVKRMRRAPRRWL